MICLWGGLSELETSKVSNKILIDFNCTYAMYRPDVKLWQCMTLMREVEQIAVARDVAVIVCGDFNR